MLVLLQIEEHLQILVFGVAAGMRGKDFDGHGILDDLIGIVTCPIRQEIFRVIRDASATTDEGAASAYKKQSSKKGFFHFHWTILLSFDSAHDNTFFKVFLEERINNQ